MAAEERRMRAHMAELAAEAAAADDNEADEDEVKEKFSVSSNIAQHS
jgi:hypothetical protein